MPALVIVPPAGPSRTLHVTAVFVVPATEAVKVCVAPWFTMALDGDTLTVIAGGGGGADPPPHPVSDPTAPTIAVNKIKQLRLSLTTSSLLYSSAVCRSGFSVPRRVNQAASCAC